VNPGTRMRSKLPGTPFARTGWALRQERFAHHVGLDPRRGNPQDGAGRAQPDHPGGDRLQIHAQSYYGDAMDPVNQLANESWEALFRAQATLAREFEVEGHWGGLPPREYGVLYALAGVKDGVRITELTEDALLTQAGVSRLVARLEKRGLVERRDDPDDGRASRIVLTAEGRAVQRRVGSRHARHVTAAMTRALSASQQESLRDLCRELVAASRTSSD
jgi:DNA-binding MarR family transcriptional regulator